MPKKKEREKPEGRARAHAPLRHTCALQLVLWSAVVELLCHAFVGVCVRERERERDERERERDMSERERERV